MGNAAGVDSRRRWRSSRRMAQAAQTCNEPANSSGSREPLTRTTSSGSDAVNDKEQ
ncbi:hypothetical protein Scep_007025 [Stephania cephalantha]|uniref:Uncharacterized protein n=1 Tax=Stephania cephalantha TaxID=152367 RepID=A0AAP0PKN5_9MAGN